VTCKGVHAFLSDWLTGDLPRGTREVFARHLESCTSCRAYVDSYERTRELAKDAESDVAGRAPEALVRAILATRAGVP
jgi:predicted anti-sigma-YlaC factor YlaD